MSLTSSCHCLVRVRSRTRPPEMSSRPGPPGGGQFVTRDDVLPGDFAEHPDSARDWIGHAMPSCHSPGEEGRQARSVRQSPPVQPGRKKSPSELMDGQLLPRLPVVPTGSARRQRSWLCISFITNGPAFPPSYSVHAVTSELPAPRKVRPQVPANEDPSQVGE